MNRLWRKMQWNIICVSMIFLFNACAAPPDKPLEKQTIVSLDHEDYGVGYINLQKLVNESQIGKVARDDFLKFARQRERITASKLEEVNNLRDVINQKGNEMGHAEMEIKKREFEKTYQEYQQLLADNRKDISRKKSELISMVLNHADPALMKVAKRMKYSIILKDPDLIAYLDPVVDITDLVLKEMKGED